jgi:hypothetical protein
MTMPLEGFCKHVNQFFIYVKQNLTILFYRKGKKADKRGKAPLYVRVTIDGLHDEISPGSKTKVLDQDFNRETKLVEPTEPNYKTINKILEKAKVDLERHFDLIQAQQQIATPASIFTAYKLLSGRLRQSRGR